MICCLQMPDELLVKVDLDLFCWTQKSDRDSTNRRALKVKRNRFQLNISKNLLIALAV